MKKLFLTVVAVAMVFATSCKKENINGAEEPVADNEFVCVVDQNANPQNAPRVDDGMGTMAHIDGNNNVWWQEGDEIAYYGKEVNAQDSTYYTLTCSKMSDNRAYFSDGNKHFGQGKHEAYYPASLVKINGADTSLVLPDAITINPNKNAAFLPMYGIGNGQHYITFHNICAVIKITIPASITASSIEISSDQVMNGKFDIEENDSKYVAAMTEENPSDDNKKITVVSQSGSFSGGSIIYVAVPAQNYTGFKFKIGSCELYFGNISLEVNKIYNADINRDFVFHFTALEDSSRVFYNPYHHKGFDYSTDGVTWSVWDDHITLNSGQKFYLKAHSTKTKLTDGFVLSGSFKVSGNIMYLLDPTGVSTTVGTDALRNLFYDCTALVDASGLMLPATTLAFMCYKLMFSGCTNLVNAPSLPATQLDEDCYADMFQGCTSLVKAPDLPATQLASCCYENMFQGCTSLVKAPDLPATQLNYNCYQSMFEGCTSLVNAPELPATQLFDECYKNMFSGCSNLQYIKAAFTDWGSVDATSGWVNGVSSTGTFVCPTELSTTTIGVNNVPTGWVVETY